MIIGIKDGFKLIGIIIVSACAVFVCTLFLNFNLDIAGIKNEISSASVMTFYQAQVATAKVTSAVSGGCLMITSLIMLFFYIKYYIDGHRKEFGILKALGYSNQKIARSFWVFGSSVFMGTLIGFCSAFSLMPVFYRVMNEEGILPEYTVQFHLIVAVELVLLPSVLCSMVSVGYAHHKLRRPVPELLRGAAGKFNRKQRHQPTDQNTPFLKELKHSTVKGRRTLVFFLGFAAFCYSAMMQMSFCMDELASIMFSVIMVVIGIVLACTTLFLAITTVINTNRKTIAMMRIMGYPHKACSSAILGGYRLVSYIGFCIGTLYQYLLLKAMISIVFKKVAQVPEYHFDIPALCITFVSFVLLYEGVMCCYAMKIRTISIKEIMLE